MRRWFRYWPVVTLIVAALGVSAAYLAAEWYTREPPNYTLIEEGLFLGGFVAQPPPGVRAVLNLCETTDPYPVPVSRWEPIADAEPVPSIEWLRRQVEFLAAQRKEGRIVFVHCRNGVSRSGMVVVAFVMSQRGWSRDAALAYVRSHRPGVRPHPSFMRLLREWESTVEGHAVKAEPGAAADRPRE